MSLVIHVVAKWMDARSQPIQIPGSVVPAKGIWTGCPDAPSDGFVSHGKRDKSVGLLLGISSLPSSLCESSYIYRTRSYVSFFNGKEIFWLVMMPVGGGRAIITLRAADRDRGK